MIGGDLKVDKYRYRARPQNINFVLFPADQTTNTISMLSAIILLSKVALDTDIFFMYEDMFKCGIIESLFIIIIVMVFIQLSIHLFTRCWFYGLSYNYSDVWTCVFGSATFRFVPIFLNIISYLTYTSWFNYEIFECARTFISMLWPHHLSFITNKWFLLYFFNIITTLPCLFIKNFSSFTPIAYVGGVAVIVSFVCMIVLLAKTVNQMGFQITVEKTGEIDEDKYGLPYLPFTNLFSKDASSLFGCIGTVMTSFYTHPFLEMVFRNMRNPTVFRCLSSVWITSFISIIFYYGFGILSYFIVQLHFRESYFCLGKMMNENLSPSDPFFKNRPRSIFQIVDYMIPDLDNENIFFDFTESHAEVVIGQIASYLVTLTSNMVYTYFMADQLCSLFIDRKKDDIPPLAISGIVIILFSIGINFVGDTATFFLDFISQIAFLILVFVLPSVFYLKLFRLTKPFWGVISIVLLVIGIPMSIAVIYFSSFKI